MKTEFSTTFIRFLLDMGGFVEYDPTVKKLIVLMCISLVFSAVMFMIMLDMNIRDRAELRKYKLDRDPDEDLILRYQYSPDGMLEIRENGCKILRQGSAVSNLINKIYSITCTVDANNRIVSIVYDNNGENKLEKVRCGKMSDEAYEKLRYYMLQQMGG